MQKKIRMGMVGGTYEAFIGSVHRRAAFLDHEIELVCGVFSSDPLKTEQTAKALYLPRHYASFSEMFDKEKNLSPDERMDFVSIVTPNYLHFEPAKMALEASFHVLLDKPLTLNLAQAVELKRILKNSGKLLALSHNYSGYPMVKEAKEMIRQGKLGKIRKVVLEYKQGWLSEATDPKHKQASWRTDPEKTGGSGGLGDIGTHVFNLAEYVSGLKIQRLCADLNTFVPSRKVDDDGLVLFEMECNAKGFLHYTQVAHGEENDIKFSIYGEEGGLSWRQLEPNTLIWTEQNQFARVIRTGIGSVSRFSLAHTRVAGGHPEGFGEAFANIYRNFSFRIRQHDRQEVWESPNTGLGQPPVNNQNYDAQLYDYPGIEEGIRGMVFIETALKSNLSHQKWTNLLEYE